MRFSVLLFCAHTRLELWCVCIDSQVMYVLICKKSCVSSRQGMLLFSLDLGGFEMVDEMDVSSIN